MRSIHIAAVSPRLRPYLSLCVFVSLYVRRTRCVVPGRRCTRATYTHTPAAVNVARLSLTNRLLDRLPLPVSPGRPTLPASWLVYVSSTCHTSSPSARPGPLPFLAADPALPGRAILLRRLGCGTKSRPKSILQSPQYSARAHLILSVRSALDTVSAF